MVGVYNYSQYLSGDDIVANLPKIGDTERLPPYFEFRLSVVTVSFLLDAAAGYFKASMGIKNKVRKRLYIKMRTMARVIMRLEYGEKQLTGPKRPRRNRDGNDRKD